MNSNRFEILSLLERIVKEGPEKSLKAVIEVEQRVPYNLRHDFMELCSKLGGELKANETIKGSDPHFIVEPYLQVRTRDQEINGTERRLTGTIKVPVLSCYNGIGSPPLLEITFSLNREEYERFTVFKPLTYVTVERSSEILNYKSGHKLESVEISYDNVEGCDIRIWTEVSQDIPIPGIKVGMDLPKLGLFEVLYSEKAGTAQLDEIIKSLCIDKTRITEADSRIKSLLINDLRYRPDELYDITYAQMQVAKNGNRNS